MFLGQRLLEKALLALGSRLEGLSQARIDEYLAAHSYQALPDLMEDIARGNRLPGITAQQLLSDEGGDQLSTDKGSVQPVAIRGTEGFMVRYANCCHPIPGDAIEGYLSSEKGMVVHRETCNNLADMRDNKERLVALRWDGQVEGEYNAELRIEVENRRGMIAVLATRINSMDVNIDKISTEDKDYQFTYVDLGMEVKNRVHLAKIMRRLRTLQSVRKVTRITN